MAGGYPDDWQAWAYAVLGGINAPPSDNNLQNLWVWTRYEKPPGDPTQWNNPLNTTQDYPGGVDQNSSRVKSYPDLQAGAQATIQTLTNGYYPDVVARLQSDQPYADWGPTAAAQVRKWGTNGFANQMGGGFNPPVPFSGGQSASQVGSPPSSGSLSSKKGRNTVSLLGSDIDLTGLLGMVQILIGLGLVAAGILIMVASVINLPGVLGALPQGRALRAVSASRPSTTNQSAPKPAPSNELSEDTQSEVAEARAGRGKRLSPQARTELTAAARTRRRSA